MTNTLWKTWIGVAALAAGALVGAAVAAGAGSTHKGSTTTTTSRPARTPETPLTGDVLASVEAAVIAKVGGAVDAATTENDGSIAGAAYEAHATKADGSHVTVILDASYNVLTVEAGHRGRGGPGHGHGPGGNGETPLAGDVAAKAKAAALAKVGGTADLATTENDSDDSAAAYEVHVTKADGSRATVILDSGFAVLGVETHPEGGPGHFQR